MNSSNSGQSGNNVTDVLGTILKKGARLWAENGQLRYRAPRGVLSPGEIEKLKAFSGQLVTMLERSAGRYGPLPQLERRGQSDRVPVTFSQFTYWRSDRLRERHTMRSLAFAMRVRGQLDIALLERSVTEIVRRHEALRTRIVVIDESPTQQVDESCTCQLRVDDLSALPEQDQAAEIERMIHELVLEPVHVAVGPLFGMRLAILREDEYVLIAAMEHIISDGFSLGVLLRDLIAVYVQGGHSLCLPPVDIQLADYSVWQRKAHALWVEQHGAYWSSRLAGCGRLTRAGDAGSRRADGLSWGKLPFRIAPDVKTALSEWCRLRRTTVVMGAFTAFVALVLRWYNASDAVVRYQTDGRFSPLLENAIGYFACVLNLRIELRDGDSFLDLLSRVTQEYCSASEHADLSYIDAQVPRPEFTRNPGFNWIPQTLRALPTVRSPKGELTFSPVPFAVNCPVLDEDYDWDYEPAIVLQDKDDVIEGTVIFSPKRTSVGTMEAFQRNFLLFVRELLRQPEQPVKDIAL